MKTVLILAQTPPPFHGQAVMQQYLVDDKWDWSRKDHVKLDYSSSIKDVGNFSFAKVGKLFKIIFKVWCCRINRSIDAVYYPPAGPMRIPLYRDVITLLLIKVCARKVILHFHAGGLSELIVRLHPIERFFVRVAFKNIDHAIVLLPWLKRETEWFSPKKVHVVPNGIEDVIPRFPPNKVRKVNDVAFILFVGNLKEEKGIFVLLAAVAKINAEKIKFRVRIMGEAHSTEIQKKIESFIKELQIEDKIDLLGTLTGDDKWAEFSRSHIFCLPTYATEAMPVSILEAMMFSLPIVTTDWRSIPDMITNGEEGFLVPVMDNDALAEKLSVLLKNPSLASEMGEAGRKKYESSFSIEKHLSKMEQVFREACH